MTRKSPSATQDMIAPVRPSMIDRLQLFGNLHVTAIITIISFMVGLGGAIAIMPMIDPSPRLLTVLVSLLMGLGIAMMALAILSLVLAFDRTATARDIAAALAAATSHERPVLLVKIADRTAARFPPIPMTVFDLVLLFRGVREAHGTKADRRHLAEQEAHREQASAIERLSIH